jgi:hypothetical protein
LATDIIYSTSSKNASDFLKNSAEKHNFFKTFPGGDPDKKTISSGGGFAADIWIRKSNQTI